MNFSTRNIDILENTLRRTGNLLDIFLLDRTTKKNIIWATDSYEERGKEYLAKKYIMPELVTGRNGMLIQPRAAKSLIEQRHRTKDKAEVFTPLKTVDQINKAVENNLINKKLTFLKWLPAIWELKRVIKLHKIDQVLIAHVLPLGTAAYVLQHFVKFDYSIFFHGVDFSFATSSRRKTRCCPLTVPSIF